MSVIGRGCLHEDTDPRPGAQRPNGRVRHAKVGRYGLAFSMAAPDPSTYFRKGFGLKAEVQDELAADYSGRLVDRLRAEDYTLTVGDVTIRLAREFGFCYGVERAVEYAYQTRRKFPDRRIFLVGEIIHNPHVNTRLREMGIEILAPDATGSSTSAGSRPTTS